MRETAAALAQRFVAEMSQTVALLDRVGQRAGIYRDLFDAWARERGLTVAPEKPPLDVREVVRVPVDDEGREIGTSPA